MYWLHNYIIINDQINDMVKIIVYTHKLSTYILCIIIICTLSITYVNKY